MTIVKSGFMKALNAAPLSEQPTVSCHQAFKNKSTWSGRKSWHSSAEQNGSTKWGMMSAAAFRADSLEHFLFIRLFWPPSPSEMHHLLPSPLFPSINFPPLLHTLPPLRPFRTLFFFSPSTLAHFSRPWVPHSGASEWKLEKYRSALAERGGWDNRAGREEKEGGE